MLLNAEPYRGSHQSDTEDPIKWCWSWKIFLMIKLTFFSRTFCLRSCSESFPLTRLSTVSSACNPTVEPMHHARLLTTCPSPLPFTVNPTCKLNILLCLWGKPHMLQPEEGKLGSSGWSLWVMEGEVTVRGECFIVDHRFQLLVDCVMWHKCLSDQI